MTQANAARCQSWKPAALAKMDPGTSSVVRETKNGPGRPDRVFHTIATYGTWLPGDQRGWIEYQRGWQLSNPIRELEAGAKMQEDACILTPDERMIVELQLEETCQYRSWKLHPKNCRSNHMYALIGSYEVPSKKVRADIKAWCTRRLKEKSNPLRENWWADRGSIRCVFDDEGVDTVSVYIYEAQDLRHLEAR